MRTIEIKTTQPFHKNKATIPTKISSLFQSEWFDFSFQFSSAFTRKKSTRGTAKGVDVGYGCVSIHRAFIGSWGTMTSLRTNNCAPLIEFGLSLYLFCGVTRLTDFSSASCRSMRLLIFLFSSFFFTYRGFLFEKKNPRWPTKSSFRFGADFFLMALFSSFFFLWTTKNQTQNRKMSTVQSFPTVFFSFLFLDCPSFGLRAPSCRRFCAFSSSDFVAQKNGASYRNWGQELKAQVLSTVAMATRSSVFLI